MPSSRNSGGGAVRTAGERDPRLRLTFILRRFERGGAERQLITLLKSLDKSRFDISVLTLYEGGSLWDEAVRIPSVAVTHLGKEGRWDLRPLRRLARRLRETRPHIVHGYMDVANVLALVGRLRGARIVWGVRRSELDISRYDLMSRMGLHLESALAHLPDLIICNSRAASRQLSARGYPSGRTIVIPNGIDTERFRADPASRQAVRAQWHAGTGEFLVGIVGRLDPMKGHAQFVRAASLVASRHPRSRFVVVGRGNLDELRKMAGSLGLRDRMVWAGERLDMPAVFSALDLTVSASLFGEGFSNVLGESMACGVPCVATDVGDAAEIVGELGWIAPPDDPAALAGRICLAIEHAASRSLAPDLLRQRIVSNYGTARLADSTAAALGRLVSGLPANTSWTVAHGGPRECPPRAK